MKKIILLLILLWAPFSQALTIPIAITTSQINISCIPSRISGAAPLYVYFDCMGTTDASDTSRPFHDLQASFDFGDSGGGAAVACGDSVIAGAAYWSCGSNPGTNSKNSFVGGLQAAHAYETAGTFTPCWTMKYGSTVSPSQCTTITVTAADTQWATTKTICVSTSGTFTSCPSGATQVTSSDADAAVAANIGSGDVRFLFRRGETFDTASGVLITQQGPGMFGAYGTGAKPIIQATTATTGNDVFTGNTAVSDWRFVDLQLEGNSGTASQGFYSDRVLSNFLFLRLDVRNVTRALLLPETEIQSNNNLLWDKIALVDSTMITLIGSASSGSNMIYAAANRMAFMGNFVDNNEGGEHGVRTQYANRWVYSNNTVQGVVSGKVDTTFRGPYFNGTIKYPAGLQSQWIVVADNQFNIENAGGMLSFGPLSQTVDQRVRDVIIERNYFNGSTGGSGAGGIGINESDITIRNNLFYLPNTTPVGSAIEVKDEGATSAATPVPNQVNTYNNVVYSGGTASNPWGLIRFITNYVTWPASTFIIKNNLIYVPSDLATGATVYVDTGTTATITHSNNTSEVAAETVHTCPKLPDATCSTAPTTPPTWEPLTGSYTINGGTSVPVWSDFFLTAQPATRTIGAVNP